MELRAELRPPAVSAERLGELRQAIRRIEGQLLGNDRESAERALRAFNAHTGHEYSPLDFLGCDAARSLDEFALEAARPAWPRVADVTRDELVEIVRRVMAADADTEYYLRLLRANVAHPAVTGLIFHPSPQLDNATAEEIVDEALAYRPFAL